MPYVSPKMVASDKVIIGLSDALAGTSLGGEIGKPSSTTKAKTKTRSYKEEESVVPAPVHAPSLGECGADSSSSLDTLSSTNTTSSTDSSSSAASDSPPLVTPYDSHTDAPNAAGVPTPIEAYSRSVYAFTMTLYNEARVNNLRRNSGKKSYSFTAPKRAQSTTSA